MDNIKILSQYSPWYILVCIAVGVAYAFFLYSAKPVWSKTTHYALATVRFILVTLLCLLLIGPLIKFFKNYSEKPVVALAIDNSQSIKLTTDTQRLNAIKNDLDNLKRQLEKAGFETEIFTFDQNKKISSVADITFNHPLTDLNSLITDIQGRYENRNLCSILLFSDGIINKGISPVYNHYTIPIFCIGAGDTIPKKDISIRHLRYNKISYRGNKFPIIAEVYNKGYAGEHVTLHLLQNGKVLDTKNLSFTYDKEVSQVEFYISSEQKGVQHYTIEAKPLKNEFTLRNNTAHAYIDIIENKEKVLIAAPAPHPDIRAIRTALQAKENAEVDIYIPGISEWKEQKYDLVILHELPDQNNTMKAFLDKITQSQASLLFIIGQSSHINLLNSYNKTLTISPKSYQRDQVLAYVNTSFEKFKTTPQDKEIISNYPPLTVPFADYVIKQEADVILYQKIGNTVSQKPLLVISNDRKEAILCGEGIWMWRLHEYLDYKSNEVFDRFFQNLVQLLSSKEDKRKFRVYTPQAEFIASEDVLFETEAYNDLYERVYGQTISLKIRDEKNNVMTYSYVNGENNHTFTVKGLNPGVYKYTATTTLSGKTERYDGEFLITEPAIEITNTTADHNLLKNLSKQSNGDFVLPGEIFTLENKIKNLNAASIIHTNEELLELVNLPWLFFLIIALATTEWFFRKYKGGY
ncbi:MAG: VWA domain-containing protein [Cytophagaceae bacterium]|nr:VWA domain-containing protein [Cytophagaceae bacterium]MDW8456606.1 VWA domain-containing protein [Cytophagaceae bacterium]